MLSKKNIAIIVLVVLVGLVYLPSLFNGFVNWDDDVHLLENIYIQPLNINNLQAIFTTTVNKIYIPLTSLTFAIEYHFFGPNPFIYHLNNLLLHIAVTVMVMLFSRQCGLSVRAAFFAALIFGIHPMHVESVAWVTERKDVLYSFFYMAALLVYCGYLKDIVSEECSGHKKLIFIWVVVLGVLSALSKPMALSLPLIMFACDWYFKRPLGKRMIFEKIYLGCFMAPIIWVTYFSHMHMTTAESSKSMFTWIWCFAFYLKKFFWPDYFTLHYMPPEFMSFSEPAFLSSMIIVIALIFALGCFRKNRLFMFAFLFFIGTIFYLLRVGGVRPEFFVLDRYMYLASVGWCLLLGQGINHVVKMRLSNQIMTLFYSVFIMFFLVLSLMTVGQIMVWKSGINLWKNQLKVEPRAYPALTYEKLAWAYFQDKEFDARNKRQVGRVIELFNKALESDPKYANAYWGLGEVYKLMGEAGIAREYLKKAVALKPDNFEASRALVELDYQKAGRQRTAEDFCKILRSYPGNTRILNKIHHFYSEDAKSPEQWEHFQGTCRDAVKTTMR